jgi:hypothetical protein
MKTSIETIIEGQNELKNLIKETLKNILPKLNDLGNKPIFKTDGSLRKNTEFLKDSLLKYMGHPISYLFDSYGTLSISFKICLTGGSFDDRTNFCEYFSQTIHLVDLNTKELMSFDQIVDYYNLNKVLGKETELKKVKDFEQKKEELRELYISIDSKVIDNKYLNL